MKKSKLDVIKPVRMNKKIVDIAERRAEEMGMGTLSAYIRMLILRDDKGKQ